MATPRMTALSPSATASPYTGNAPSPSSVPPRSPRRNSVIAGSQQQQARAGTASNLGRSRTGTVAGASIDEPAVEVRKTLALLLGDDQQQQQHQQQNEAGGLVGELDRMLSQRNAGTLDGNKGKAELLALVDRLIATLRSSPLGALPLDPAKVDEALRGDDINAASASASAQASDLFRKRMRAREGAEVCAAVLNQALQHQSASSSVTASTIDTAKKAR